MSTNASYLKRAWEDLTSEKGWVAPVIILTLVNCIPVVGQIFTAGYLLDWAREGAWGMGRSFPRQVGDLGKHGKWGLFQLGLGLIWTLPPVILGGLLGIIPVAGVLLSIVMSLATLAAGIISYVAAIRAVIYDDFRAGLQITRIMRMVKRDAGGLVKVFLIQLLEVAAAIIAGLIIAIPMVPAILAVGSTGAYGDVGIFAAALAAMGLAYAILVVVVSLLLSFATTLIDMLALRGYGLWVAQFLPATWGGFRQPAPFENPAYAAANAEPAAPPIVVSPADVTVEDAPDDDR